MIGVGKEQAIDILVHYFEQAGVDMSGDGRAEIEAAVNGIVKAAVEQVREENAERS